MNFFRNFLASFLGSITALILIISLGFFLLAGIASVATFDKNILQDEISSLREEILQMQQETTDLNINENESTSISSNNIAGTSTTSVSSGGGSRGGY